MRKSLKTRFTALLLSLWLLVSLSVPAAWADGGEIILSTAEDLTAFAQSCSLDTWSQGKTVRLTADLDLTGSVLSPIPSFGGTFLGNGHTISGLYLAGSGSRQGLFRYIQAGAVVSDLNVTGTLLPAGSRSSVGGIAGVNAGTLQNCTFRGTVKGDTAVGGVAGLNEETGQINGCSAAGTILGRNATGGVVGKNLGILLKCTSSASVNTTESASAPTLDQLDPDAAIGQLTSPANDGGDAVLNSHTDTGGIAGYSSGVIQSCTNTGTVGYPHVGYNVGGVAGRQTGYLSGCVNSGTVHGRKDVGGIAGQAEPYVALNPGSDTLARLRTELDTLDTLICQALDDADASNADISARLTAMGQTTGNARDSSKRLLDHTADFIDGNVDSLNSLSVTLTGALDKISPALDDLGNSADWLGKLAGDLEDAMEKLDIPAADRDGIRKAIGRLSAANGAVNTATGKLTAAVARLSSALIEKDHVKEQDALTEAGNAVAEMGEAYRDAGEAVEELACGLDNVPQFPDTDALHQFGQSLRDLGGALESIKIPETVEGMDDEFLESVISAAKAAAAAAGDLGTAAAELLGDLTDILMDASASFQDAVSDMRGMSRALKRAFSLLSDAAAELSQDGPMEFTALGEETRAAGEDLYGALADLSTEMEALNTAVKDSGNLLSADLRAVSRQFNTVFGVLLDALEDMQRGGSTDRSDHIEDTSDENIAATRLGKVADCRNTGTVEGDRNVGGVLGAMAIEYDLDPEDDDVRLSLGSTYETKAVLQRCLNRGNITAKKDCVGGLVGRMDLGTAVDCQNYGGVKSTGGNYVGGVVGQGSGSVRSCCAKCTLSGSDYVGGIAGWAESLTDSAAIATIADGAEYVGAVAGDADLKNGVIRNNCFVDTGVAAIDGVSYTGKAAPVAFEDLRTRPGIPTEFISFTLTLVAGGKKVAAIPFLYGDDLALIELPEVPEQENAYGTWPDFDTSGLESDITLEAVYTPWVTLAASEEQSGKLALALAGGRFTQDVALHVAESTVTPPEEVRGTQDRLSVWEVALTGTDLSETDTVPLRLLNEGGGKATVWQLTDGVWRQVDADSSGQYLLLDMTGTSGTFCIRSGQSSFPLLLIPALLFILALAVLLLVKRRKKKTRKTTGSEGPAVK